MMKDGMIIRIHAAMSKSFAVLNSHFTRKFARNAPNAVPKNVVQMPRDMEFPSALYQSGFSKTSKSRLIPSAFSVFPKNPGLTICKRTAPSGKIIKTASTERMIQPIAPSACPLCAALLNFPLFRGLICKPLLDLCFVFRCPGCLCIDKLSIFLAIFFFVYTCNGRFKISFISRIHQLLLYLRL